MQLNNISKLLIVFSSISIFSCAKQDGKLTDSEIDNIKKEVLLSFEGFENGLSGGDFEAVSNYYSDDSRFYWVEGGTIAYPNGAAARKVIKDFYPTLKSMTFTSLFKKITPINNSTAMLYVEYEQVLVSPTDEQLEINGAMTILMKKKDSDWKFIIGHSSFKNQ